MRQPGGLGRGHAVAVRLAIAGVHGLLGQPLGTELAAWVGQPSGVR